MPLSREEKLHHIMIAIKQSGSTGVSREVLEEWVETTFRCSGFSLYHYFRDLRIRRWVRYVGGRYTLADDGEQELLMFDAAKVEITYRAPEPPSDP